MFYKTGKYAYSQKVFCDLPEVDMLDKVIQGYGFRVSISNDGHKFSDEKTLLIFDSTCMDCSEERGCFQKVSKACSCHRANSKLVCQYFTLNVS